MSFARWGRLRYWHMSSPNVFQMASLKSHTTSASSRASVRT